jgi:hypothetical protein
MRNSPDVIRPVPDGLDHLVRGLDRDAQYTVRADHLACLDGWEIVLMGEVRVRSRSGRYMLQGNAEDGRRRRHPSIHL